MVLIIFSYFLADVHKFLNILSFIIKLALSGLKGDHRSRTPMVFEKKVV